MDLHNIINKLLEFESNVILNYFILILLTWHSPIPNFTNFHLVTLPALYILVTSVDHFQGISAKTRQSPKSTIYRVTRQLLRTVAMHTLQITGAPPFRASQKLWPCTGLSVTPERLLFKHQSKLCTSGRLTQQLLGVLHIRQDQTAGANPLHPSLVSNLPFTVLFIAIGSLGQKWMWYIFCSIYREMMWWNKLQQWDAGTEHRSCKYTLGAGLFRQ